METEKPCRDSTLPRFNVPGPSVLKWKNGKAHRLTVPYGTSLSVRRFSEANDLYLAAGEEVWQLNLEAGTSLTCYDERYFSVVMSTP